jgi:N-acetylglucosaminyl-diphospho-decaprenol L-rhamnosyltransferase
MADISILIVAYRTRALTVSSVASALAIKAIQEVIVVDNASHDGTVEALAAMDSERLRILANSRNVGFGAAHNQGVKVARGSNLILLNSDATIDAGTAAELVAEVGRYKGRCIAGPRLVGTHGEIQRSAGLLPGARDLMVRALGLHQIGSWLSRSVIIGSVISWTRMSQEFHSAESATETIDTTMVSGACFAIGRDAFREIGGFDEDFFLYFEDADLCRRALKAGMAIRYVPQAVVPHIGGASSSEDYHFSPRHARSMRLYLRKWYGPAGAALAAVLMFLRAVGLSIGAPRRAGRAWRAFGATLGFGGAA